MCILTLLEDFVFVLFLGGGGGKSIILMTVSIYQSASSKKLEVYQPINSYLIWCDVIIQSWNLSIKDNYNVEQY